MGAFHTHYKPKVYTASKIHHAAMWRNLREEWKDNVQFTARWPDHEDKLSSSAEYARTFWMQDIQDVVRADCVLLYALPTEKLRGALVEAGAGIATGKQVVLVGNNPDFGSWQYHPMVTRTKDLSEALGVLIGPWRLPQEEVGETTPYKLESVIQHPSMPHMVTGIWSDGYENTLDLRNYPSDDMDMVRSRLRELRASGSVTS